ncbi:hypothetical protein F2Q70_00031478 [Brassica cretica]|uniref:AAA+ ATPase domain-containing protein n=1 Tax=Brassica cretica TaxID=69181 RepID=A0A8S9FEV1_BRACR|nr:hypothetical protein F2Q70_00031478 [Brassica cretica]
MIEDITNDVLGKLNVTPSEDFGNFVGLKDHMKIMSSLLDLESKEVKMVGIWGPSGIGKTTIARALYSRLLRHFQGRIFIDRSFISKSKEVFSKANNDDYNMKLHLQEQFLSKLLGKEGIEVDHLGADSLDVDIKHVLRFSYEGLSDEDQALFRHIACLFNLEKVDDIKLLLADSFKSFEIGLENLVARSLVHVRLNIVEMHTLLQLLGKEIVREQSRNPGKREFIVNSEDVCDVLEDCLHLTDSFDHLPPKLKSLCWEGYPMKSLPSNFCPERLVKLKMKNSKLKKLWDGSWNLTCLKEVNLWGSENLKEIPDLSRATNLEKLYLNYRLSWVKNPSSIQIFNNLTKGTKRVLGISLNIDEIDDELHINENAFKKMGNLRFLAIFTNTYMLDEEVRLHLPNSFDHLPPKLKSLCWEGYPMKSLPSNFCPERLVKLKMKNSKLEKLWEGSWAIQNLACLKEVNLWGSENLKEIPDLSRATNLEKLYLNYRLSWVKNPSFMQNFNNLTKVETLPTPINHETSKGLHVAEFCMDKLKFEKLVEGIQPLMCMGTTLPASLKVLFLSDIPNMVALPFSIQNLYNLTDMKIIRCTDLEILPTGINLVSLERLNLNGCSRLKTFPDISRNISSLYLEETAIEEVPPWTENFSKLKYLLMRGCSKLEYVYLNVSKLKDLELVNFSQCGALSGADLSGYPSGIALEGEITGTESQASSSGLDNNVPKVEFSFINCFKLDEEAVLQQLSYEKLIFSGEEMPLYFTHRTTGTSMAFPLVQSPHSPPFFRFRVCAVAVFDCKPTSGTIGVFTKVNCQFKSRLGSYYDSPYQHDYFSVYQKGSYLLLLDPLRNENATPTKVDYDYVNIQFDMSSSKFKLKEWGDSQLCGKVDDALELFKQMPRKNVISWTTMICGHVPDYRSALHDVEDEQKEAMLWYHMRGLLLPLQSEQYQNLENCDLRPDDEVQSSSFKSFVLR